MVNALDIVYGAGVVAAAPYWVVKGSARRKVVGAFRERMGRGFAGVRDVARPAVMIHAVSVGEINATRALVEALRKRVVGGQFVISVTTQTGWGRAVELYGKDADVVLVRYPLDFSGAVGRVLEAMRPSVVVLMELELWPNFLRGCRDRGIPVVLVNGRMTPYSFKRYRLVKGVAGAMLRGLASVCVQDEAYGKRFVELGAPSEKVKVTGTMKFDTAYVGERVEGEEELAGAVGIRVGEKVWVCGSTGPGEEEMVLGVYRRLLSRFAGLRLVIVPRKPERFEEVAGVIRGEGFGVVRRSETMGRVRADGDIVPRQTGMSAPPDSARQAGMSGALSSASAKADPTGGGGGAGGPAVVLGDTMGELRTFYSLASVVFVGRTLVDLGSRQHGSDMMEPAGLGKAVVVGPYTGNFAEVMLKMREGGAVKEVATEGELERVVGELLADEGAARELGERARGVVMREKGATGRHVEVIAGVLGRGGRGMGPRMDANEHE